MPIRLSDIDDYGAPIYFQKPGKVDVMVGPCSSVNWKGEKIPLDGRHYICAGTVILKNELELQAEFRINTHTFDFLDSVRVYIEKETAWYSFDEDELFEVLGVSRENSTPYTWQPDRPLDYHIPGPYPMKWPIGK